MNAPQNIQAESGLIAACIAEPAQIPAISLIVSPKDFYLPRHEKLFAALISMSEASEPIDAVTLADRARVVSFDDITALWETSLPSHAEHYARIIRESSIKRQLVTTMAELSQHLSENGAGSTEALSQLDAMVRRFSETAKSPFLSAKDLAGTAISAIELAQEGDRESELTTGIAAVDRALGGLKRGDLVILAGRPSMGKTALACNIAHNVALTSESVCFVSIESPAQKIFNRLIAAWADIDNQKIQALRLNDFETRRATESARAIGDLPIYFIERERRWDKIQSAIRALKVKDPSLSLVILDYVGLVRTGYRVERYQELGIVSGDCKQLALDLNVSFLLLSQLNRAVEGRQDKRPSLSDLRESGALEQDADIVGLLYRVFYYNESADPHDAELDIAKNRDGATGIIRLHFDPATVKFSDPRAGDSQRADMRITAGGL